MQNLLSGMHPTQIEPHLYAHLCNSMWYGQRGDWEDWE